MDKIKVLIADDHALVREGIRAIIALHEGITVVGEAEDGLKAIEMVRQLRPDVVLMDIGMPKLGGLEATIEIKKENPGMKIIVLTQYEDREYVSRFLKAGVSGYLLKRAVGGELISAIRAVNRGEVYLFSSIASEVVSGYLGRGGTRPEDDPYDMLSDREKQVLKLLAEGQSHKEVAQSLGISVKTVIAHQTNISDKLNIRSRTGLVKFAIAKGIIKL